MILSEAIIKFERRLPYLLTTKYSVQPQASVDHLFIIHLVLRLRSNWTFIWYMGCLVMLRTSLLLLSKLSVNLRFQWARVWFQIASQTSTIFRSRLWAAILDCQKRIACRNTKIFFTIRVHRALRKDGVVVLLFTQIKTFHTISTNQFQPHKRPSFQETSAHCML